MREVVVGVSTGRSSDRALDQALAATGERDCLLVVQAWTRAAPGEVDGSRAATRSAANGLLAASRRAGRDLPAARAEARHGDPAQVLVRASAQADLVVVGGGPVGFPLGPLAAALLSRARCPVLLAPHRAPDPAVTRIVVGVDDSDCARGALRWALEEGSRRACPVLALYVDASLSPAAPAQTQTWLEDQVAVAAAETSLARVGSEVRQGSPAAILLAEAGPDDVLVVGARGHGGFVGLELGSIALHCSEHARGPVVVVPADLGASGPRDTRRVGSAVVT